ncbi:hypothetical protein [Paracoccus tibetensis]|uniref:Uncharacterized protein n=1 Tax=Paracoccus tibetensis TaxID=336292 RepID=A0A1G5HCF8_9RHOB|nr:hypothetical protein [Paracoccus tibetensis]SCY61456.1 hypothetical protein SAMN05660710_02104 [Paracoccus tibetensis]
MPINVFPWPPVGVVAAEWTSTQPVARLRSGLSGRDVMQASQRKRRLASLEVSALAHGRDGAGYCEALKELLEGGIHAVRLLSTPVNWFLDESDRRAGRGDPRAAALRAGQPLAWFVGAAAPAGPAVAEGQFWLLPISGASTITRAARPGDFVRLYNPANRNVWQSLRVIAVRRHPLSGAVTLKVDRQPTIANGVVDLAGQDEGVFRVDGPLPRSVQPVTGDWRYSWSFREVFADEVGGFTERPNTWI